MGLVLITTLLLAVIMSIMAVGVIFGRRPLRGSCGGVTVGADGEPIRCDNCGSGGCRSAAEGEEQQAA